MTTLGQLETARREMERVEAKWMLIYTEPGTPESYEKQGEIIAARAKFWRINMQFHSGE